MSAVRLCDQCGKVFSENEKGWSTYQAAIVDEDEQGNLKPKARTMDSCPVCTTRTFNPGKHRKALNKVERLEKEIREMDDDD